MYPVELPAAAGGMRRRAQPADSGRGLHLGADEAGGEGAGEDLIRPQRSAVCGREIYHEKHETHEKRKDCWTGEEDGGLRGGVGRIGFAAVWPLHPYLYQGRQGRPTLTALFGT